MPSFLLLKSDNWMIVTRRHFVELPSIPRQVLLDLASRSPTFDEDPDSEVQSRGVLNGTPFQQHANMRSVVLEERILDAHDNSVRNARVTMPSPVANSPPLPQASTLANVTPRRLSFDFTPDVSLPPPEPELAAPPPTPAKVVNFAPPVGVKAAPLQPKVKPAKQSKKTAAASVVDRIKTEVAEKFGSAMSAEEFWQSEAERKADRVARQKALTNYVFIVSPEALGRAKRAKNMSFPVARRKYNSTADESGLKEIRQLVDKNIFLPAHWHELSKDMKSKLINCFTFFKEKYKSTGVLEKLKARMVAGGDRVDSTILGDISSPTARLETIMMLHSLAAQFNWKIANMDVPGAYLNTTLPEKDRIPMKLGKEEVDVLLQIKPEWAPFRCRDGTMIVVLHGGLYGLPQAAKLWNEMIVASLIELGYKPSTTDPCCFVKRDSRGRRSILILYVDDICHFYEHDRF